MVRRKFRAAIPKASKLVALWHFHLRNVALDAGLTSKNRDYARYIILGTARTGSNYLRGLLNSHSQIIAFGELFRCYHEIGWDFSYLPRNGSILSLFQNHPVEFLETRVYGNPPKHLGAVGFKIFYYHARENGWEPLWTYMGNDKGLKVIHIKRRNILKTHLSRRKAEMTSAWVRRNFRSAKPFEPIRLDYEECLEVFQGTREREEEFDAFFADHERIEVIYENLSRDSAGEMGRIQSFLGVAHEAVKPSTVKQAREPLSRAIVNYAELKERFMGTPWQELFEE